MDFIKFSLIILNLIDLFSLTICLPSPILEDFKSVGHNHHHHEVKCAKVWNYSGTQMHIGQNQAYGDLAIYNFVPHAIQMRYGCVLSMVDDTGVVSEIDSSFIAGNGLCWYRPMTFACCECHGCYGALTPENSENACALMYEHSECSACLGNVLEAQSGDDMVVIPILDDSISSIIVRPGCQLEIYKFANYSGEAAIVTGIIEVLGPSWNDQISSFRCRCGGGSTSVPTTSSTTIATTSASTTQVFTTLTDSEDTTTSVPEPIEDDKSTTTKILTTTNATTTTTTKLPSTSTVSSTLSSTTEDEDATTPFYPIY